MEFFNNLNRAAISTITLRGVSNKQCLFTFYHFDPQCFLPRFKSIGLPIQEKEFQDGGHDFPLEQF